MSSKIIGIDFFCGAGGLTRGLLDAGIEVSKGFDLDDKAKETYEKNNPKARFFAKDVSLVTKEEVMKGIDIDDSMLLFAGCAPCQPFSAMKKGSKEKSNDKNLLLQFGRLISEVKPDFIFAENVPGLRYGKGKRIFRKFERLLEDNGYSFEYGTLDAKDYGVPQKRRRFILLASLHGQINLPTATHGIDSGKLPYVVVKDVIKKFPVIRAGSKHKKIPNHQSRGLSRRNKRRLLRIRKDGGTRFDLPSRLRLNCHKKHNGHTDVYGRMKWNETAPALTCKCTSLSNGRFGHPTQLRAISVREAAALQTFPDNYVFYGNLADATKWVGNAVPPQLAKVFGEQIIRHVGRKGAL